MTGGARCLVIGAGILGTLTALRLASDGIAVDLVDDRPALWGGATAAAEGKAHLGYVYAKATDPTIALLAEAAHRFARDVDDALDTALPWADLRSAPFDYVVADDSQISRAEFEDHVTRVHRIVRDLGSGHDYLGERGGLTVEHVGTDPRGDVFRTPERAVDVVALRRIVTRRIDDDPRIRCRLGETVVGPRRDATGWWVDTERGETIGPYDVVVNCAWERRVRLDRAAGLCAEPSPSLRLRAFVHGTSHGPPRSQTVVLGPYGDFVRFADGRTYASWYPTGLLGFHVDDGPPGDWSDDVPAHVGDSMIVGLRRFAPEVDDMRNHRVLARVVVAHGTTDIDDPDSGLHQRDDAVVFDHDGWFSVRSPKLTTAPMLAARAAASVVEALR